MRRGTRVVPAAFLCAITAQFGWDVEARSPMPPQWQITVNAGDLPTSIRVLIEGGSVVVRNDSEVAIRLAVAPEPPQAGRVHRIPDTMIEVMPGSSVTFATTRITRVTDELGRITVHRGAEEWPVDFEYQEIGGLSGDDYFLKRYAPIGLLGAVVAAMVGLWVLIARARRPTSSVTQSGERRGTAVFQPRTEPTPAGSISRGWALCLSAWVAALLAYGAGIWGSSVLVSYLLGGPGVSLVVGALALLGTVLGAIAVSRRTGWLVGGLSVVATLLNGVLVAGFLFLLLSW